LVRDWFEATRDEHHAILDLMDSVKRKLEQELRPQGFNVGFNAGAAAGQTVFHLHVHIISGRPFINHLLTRGMY